MVIQNFIQFINTVVKCCFEKHDTGNFRNEDNERLEKALLMAFDPCANDEILELLKPQLQTEELTQEILISLRVTWEVR